MDPMKKITATLFLLFGLLLNIISQTVDSIKIEQVGELIKIHYKILNSNPNQVFKVTVLCSINGGLQSELKSLSGDFGDNVVGGRSEYMVLWDVLKDVDEVNSVDFSVRAELLKDDTPKTDKKKNVPGIGLYIFGIYELPQKGYGGKIGYMRSWGLSAMYIKGKIPYSGSQDVPDWVVSLDLIKRIVNNNSFKMHLYAGMNHSAYPEYYSEAMHHYLIDNYFGIEGGFICNINLLAFSIGLGTLQHLEASVDIGLGIRF
jgi:hypothetical protein